MAHSVVLAFINAGAPSLYNDPRFKCSESYTRHILKKFLDFSYRTGTQAAQKLPPEWENDCLDMSMRLTWHIGVNHVPPELVINADQTGVSYLGTGNKTWEIRGAKQVPTIGNGEKRQFTIMVAITASGMMLPWQVIFKGKTPVSLPSESSRRRCEQLGFHFTPGGEKHWSTLECMKLVSRKPHLFIFNLLNLVQMTSGLSLSSSPTLSVSVSD